MIFDHCSMKINDFWWFFDENWLDKFETPVCKLKFSCQILVWFFITFSWKSMIFHVFLMKINDFWWFFDENLLEKFDTPVCKLKFSRQIWFLMNFNENQWFLMIFRWKFMIFDDFSMKMDYKKSTRRYVNWNFHIRYDFS